METSASHQGPHEAGLLILITGVRSTLIRRFAAPGESIARRFSAYRDPSTGYAPANLTHDFSHHGVPRNQQHPHPWLLGVARLSETTCLPSPEQVALDRWLRTKGTRSKHLID